MPLFDFKCTKCETVEEQYTPAYEKRESICTKCGSIALRLNTIYPSSIIFNGDGWTGKLT